MPTTKTGEALLRDMLDPDEPLFPMDPGATIDAIEAEAREDKRARIRAAVAKYIAHHSHEPGRNCVSAFCAAGLHSAVLRIIDKEEDTDATD